jgi:23S rRNA pseudouridine2605 synthase
VSLERALSKLGIASRVEARRCIETGRVRVGDRVVRDPRWRVDPDLDRIAVDGVPARRATAVYLVLHKPVGVVTTRRDPEGRRTVYDLLPADAPHLGAVGRLDLDSSGLLLFTNDTRLAARLTDPLTHVTKVYDVRLDAPITAADAARLGIRRRLERPAHAAGPHRANRSARRDARAGQIRAGVRRMRTMPGPNGA